VANALLRLVRLDGRSSCYGSASLPPRTERLLVHRA